MENKPFDFGKVSTNTPRPKEKNKKAKPVERQMKNATDAFNCPDRTKTRYSFCINGNCVCQYQKYSNEDIYLEINKSRIQDFFHDKKVGEYAESMLKLEWNKAKLRGRLKKMVHDFIKQCRYVYGLDLLIRRRKVEKVNTATEAKNCHDRTKIPTSYCKGCKVTENGRERLYSCFYAAMSDDDVNREVMREFFMSELDPDIISEWDKITLTFNWYSLSPKQEKLVTKFISKYQYLLPNLNNQTKKVKRRPVKTTP